MNIQNKWRNKGRRNRGKGSGVKSQSYQRPHLPTPNPTLPSRSSTSRHVTEPLERLDNRTNELLEIITTRLTRLEHYVYDTSERLKRDKYRKENPPSISELWSELQRRTSEVVRRESIIDSFHQIEISPRGRRVHQQNTQTEAFTLPRTIDITQCRYCSS